MALIVNDLSNICQQRARRQLLNVPTFRFDLVSPYGGDYSAFDFNMRRKAEILKYNANATNTKTNNLTKSQVFSQLVNTSNLASVNKNSTKCIRDSSNQLIYRPTSDSDVPGPVILLYDDATVPLYNYATNNRSYPSQDPNNFNYWNVYTKNDILCMATTYATQYNSNTQTSFSVTSPSTVETILFTLYILPNINQSSYTYTVNTPIRLFLVGNYTGPQTIQTHVRLNLVNVNVYFNQTVINGPTFPTHPSISALSSVFLTIPGNAGAFNANAFIGNLQFQLPNLPTLNGYVFDIKLTFSFDTLDVNTISSLSQSDFLQFSVYMNSSFSTDSQSQCSIYVSPTPPVYSTFSFSGV
jgi:hypothetical protein